MASQSLDMTVRDAQNIPIRKRLRDCHTADLLFFHRLTDAKLPEETYHSWSWVPVEQEDGTVGGFINNTFGMLDSCQYNVHPVISG